MASKLGTILSLFFIFIAFLFGVDFVMIQLTYTSLDSLSSTVSYRISKTGEINDSLKSFVYENANATIEPISADHAYEEGAILGYYLIKEYNLISYEAPPINIKIKRFAVINIYG